MEQIKKDKKQVLKKESKVKQNMADKVKETKDSKLKKVKESNVTKAKDSRLTKAKDSKLMKVRDAGAKKVKESKVKMGKEVKVKKTLVKKGAAKGEQAAAASIKKELKPKKLEFKNSSEAAKFVAKIADERKADYIKILNVGPRLAITDYFVIISAGNTRLTKHIAEEIQKDLKKYNVYAMHVEGVSEGNWILIDFDDFVVHIFTDEYRQYYDIERLWRDSKVIRIKALDTDEDIDIDADAAEGAGENIKSGINEYPDEHSYSSDDGINIEVKDI